MNKQIKETNDWKKYKLQDHLYFIIIHYIIFYSYNIITYYIIFHNNNAMLILNKNKNEYIVHT